MSLYAIIKHAHLLIIVLTFVFFIINLVLLMKESEKVNNKVLKIGPHILYTLFVITFIYLAAVNPLNLIPFAHSWATTKLAGFVFYLLSITLALKWAKSNLWRIAGAISAVFWLAMTARLGFADHLKVKDDGESAYNLTQAVVNAFTLIV